MTSDDGGLPDSGAVDAGSVDARTGDAGGFDAGGSNMLVDAGDPSTLVVLRTTRFHSESGVVEVPYDFATKTRPTLRVGTLTVSGAVTAPGRFEFAHVPSGVRFLTWGATTIVSPHNPIDFSDDQLGRAGVALSDGGVGLTIEATGLSAWVSTSELQLTAANSNVFGFHFETALPTPLVVGVTPTHLPFDSSGYFLSWWGEALTPLISSAAGDGAYLTELKGSEPQSAPDAGTSWWRVLDKSAVLTGLNQVDHTVTPVSSTFAANGASDGFFAEWNRPSFWQYSGLINPNIVASTSSETFGLAVMPYTGEAGPYASAPDLVVMRHKGATFGSVVTPSLPFTNPYPSSWPLVMSVSECFSTSGITVGTGSVVLTGCMTGTTSGSTVGHDAVSCVLGPPTDLALDGQQMYGDAPLRSLTPTLSWLAPNHGTASSYEVTVLKIVNTTPTPIATFVTDTESVALPSGVITSGNVYAIRVRAWSAPFSATQYPFRSAFPAATADGITGVLRAP